MAAESYHEVARKSWEARTRREARLIISQRVGLHSRLRTPFTLDELNSIVAYVSGRHHVDKRTLKRQHMGKDIDRAPVTHGELRRAVVGAVKARLKDEDALTEPDAKMLAYDPGPGDDRPLRVAALRRIALFVETHKDERPRP